MGRPAHDGVEDCMRGSRIPIMYRGTEGETAKVCYLQSAGSVMIHFLKINMRNMHHTDPCRQMSAISASMCFIRPLACSLSKTYWATADNYMLCFFSRYTDGLMGVPLQQPHRHSGLATLPSVVAIPKSPHSIIVVYVHFGPWSVRSSITSVPDGPKDRSDAATLVLC